MQSKPSHKLIINVVGYSGAGKSTVCDYLVRHKGFTLYRPSDALRHYAQKHGKQLNGNQDYIDCNKELMATDPEALIRPVLESTKTRICIDGLRTPVLMDELAETSNAYTIALDAPIEVRFARLHGDEARSGHRAPPTLAAFAADEDLDRYNPDPYLANVEATLRLADKKIDTAQLDTDGVIKEVNRIVEALLA